MNEASVYWPGDSVLHALDPRLKVGAMVWISLLLTITGWQGLVIGSLGFIILSLVSRLPLHLYRSAIVMLFWLAVFYFIAGGWVWPNSWRFWQGHWSLSGIQQAGIVLWRIAVLFGLTRLFAGVTPALEQGLGIAYYCSPLSRLTPKAADFALLITLTLRFIPLLLEEASLLGKARAAKGSVPDSIFARLTELANFLLALLLLSLRRAEEAAENLLARGYASGTYRTLSTKEWSTIDNWGVVVAGLWGLGILIVQ